MKARGGNVLFGSIVATLMALTTALTASAAVPKLAHRWSFNGDYADSIGGTTATMIGSAVGFNEGNTAVVMSGAGNGAGSLNLGVDMLPTDVPGVTVEMWFTHNGIKNWARLFDFGQNNQNYFVLTLCQGSDGKDRIEIKKANATLFATDNSMTPYAVGTPYHVSITFRAFSDGATEDSLDAARRDDRRDRARRFGDRPQLDHRKHHVPQLLHRTFPVHRRPRRERDIR